MNRVVFVVDDDGTNLMKASEALEEKFRVITMDSALKMFPLMEKLTPDLILLDVEMPVMKGFDAIVKLKANPEWADIPVLFMTGWDDDMIMTHCFELGALDIITKPFSPVVMLKRVSNYMNMVLPD